MIMYAYPLFPQRNTCSLDGFWQFAFLGSNMPMPDIKPSAITFNEVMPVPGCFDATPKYAGMRGVVAYKRNVKVSAPGRYRLILHGLGLAGKVFYNDNEICYCKSAWSQHSVEFDIDSEFFELTVMVNNQIKPGYEATILFHPNYDFYGYGGIYRSVELEKLPEGGHFERVKVETLDLNGKVKISGHYTQPLNELQIAFDNGESVTVTDGIDGTDFAFETTVPSPELWSLENPVLHTLKVKSYNDEIIEQFGLRTIEAQKGRILLNGKPVRLIGYNRHDLHPQFGPAVPDGVWAEDLQLLKELNCNFIRGSHYPQSQRFLDLCDRLGFLVWEESLGWGNRKAVVTDPEFIDLQLEQTRNMLKVSCNHPSVIIWGFTNEINDCEESGDILVRKLAAAVKKDDPSRLVTMATMFVQKSLSLDVFDVISFNVYPAWYESNNPDEPRPLQNIPAKLDEVITQLDNEGYGDRPLIISEIGAGALYGWHDWIHGYWSEEYQADYLSEVCQYFKNHSRLTGLALWQFTDAKSFNASVEILQRPRAFNNKGTLDEYRRPKLAYNRVKAEYAAIRDDWERHSKP